MEERFDNEDTSRGSSGSLGVPARKSLAVGLLRASLSLGSLPSVEELRTQSA